MEVNIHYGKELPVSLDKQKQFEKYVKRLLIEFLRKSIKDNALLINRSLRQLKINYRDLSRIVPRLVKVVHFNGGFVLGLNDSVELKGYIALNVIKSLEYGSQITGYPKPVILLWVKYVKSEIVNVYRSFIGMR